VSRALSLLALIACAGPTPNPAGAHSKARFLDRTIDLGPHLAGYPYAGFTPDWAADRVYFTHAGPDGTSLRFMAWSTTGADPALARPVTSVDWSTRSMWGLHTHPSGDLFFLGDETNDERINLFRIAAADGTVTALTREPYLYGASLSPDDTRWAILARRGEGPVFETCLETMALDGSDRVPVLCDSSAATLTWGSPSWAPDGSGVVVTVALDGQRDRKNLAWVPFAAPALQLVTDPSTERTRAWTPSDWVDAHHPLLVTTEAGIPTVATVDLATGARQALASFDADIDDAFVLHGGRLLVLTHDPTGDRLHLLDGRSGEPVADPIQLDGDAQIVGEPDGDRLLVQLTSASSPRTLHRLDASDGLAITPWLAPPAPIASRLVQCEVERVTFPTHDIDPATGAPRVLDAILYTPRAPVAPPTARILSFYGGGNRFDTETQVFCEAGLSTLSPAVRGSYGHGEAFARLNDGDLGGDEIADLFAAAAFLESRGWERGRIGVYGRSHGGYAAMRALTFPPGTNGHDDPYPFAFGMADAGFSDIVTFHDACNIPDWVLLEAGDPATEAEALRARSPLAHVERLAAPLMLVHGEQDSRVPVQESRQMAEACAAAGKVCDYLEVPGQGHRVSGVANETEVYRRKLAFLAEHLFR
jgi:dipeptidyl aminopeptidase/acylaminoacyl peptidase